eukprot:XP_001700280.1 predicted protein [Chlamydomonas reinhardtii]
MWHQASATVWPGQGRPGQEPATSMVTKACVSGNHLAHVHLGAPQCSPASMQQGMVPILRCKDGLHRFYTCLPSMVFQLLP